jgi:glycosyltransferase involved in cell wall biosynthesis
MRAAKKILTVSEPIAELCRQSFPQFADKVQAVNNALPDATRTDCLRAQSVENAANQANPAIASNPTLHLLSVGRIHPRKGFHHILEALSRLNPDKRARIHYTIAGATGKHRTYLTKLKNTAAHHGIQLELQLDCTPEALHACYQKAELFALTSIRYRNSIEGFGLVYLEAAAHGLPAIAYDHGGVRAAIRDGETGWLIPAGDTQRLASKIAELTDQPARVRRMGQGAYKQALQRTWSDVVTESLSQLP